MNPKKLIVGGALFAFLLYGVFWFMHYPGDALHDMNQVFLDPWSISFAILMDLVLGLTLFSLIVFSVEQSKLRALLWIVSFFALGNIMTCVYFLVNFKKIMNKLES